ncbi:hypothetical protein B0H19DRAFT_1078841 [Mycena capillaripes]|nr:hypothetical protein B0H19DRAFT_1078841 [Mycena capillaripes]
MKKIQPVGVFDGSSSAPTNTVEKKKVQCGPFVEGAASLTLGRKFKHTIRNQLRAEHALQPENLDKQKDRAKVTWPAPRIEQGTHCLLLRESNCVWGGPSARLNLRLLDLLLEDVTRSGPRGCESDWIANYARKKIESQTIMEEAIWQRGQNSLEGSCSVWRCFGDSGCFLFDRRISDLFQSFHIFNGKRICSTSEISEDGARTRIASEESKPQFYR